MSEQDTKKLQQMYHNLRYRKGSAESRSARRVQMNKYQSNLELTIRLRESTINELKTLSWSLYQRKEGGTYDEIVSHLIKSFDECRNNHYNKGNNIEF
jgi:hypothetical protein